jgi:OOP family OmpA-OmpF porin
MSVYIHKMTTSIVYGMVAIFALVLVAAAAVPNVRTVPAGQKEKIHGVIAGRNGDQLILKDTEDKNVVVVLGSATQVKTPKNFHLRHKEMPATSLVPGLRVTAEGVGNEQGQLMADKISFGGKDYKTAQDIQAGVTPLVTTQQRIQADQRQMQAEQKRLGQQQQSMGTRLSEMGDYETKYQTAVYFAPGQTTLTPDDKARLDTIANQAKQLQGYMIEVVGFADPTGNAAQNQKLSEDRAYAVVTYLSQQDGVPTVRILRPMGMGTSKDVGAQTPQTMQNERRAEVKVLLNKGLQPPTS